MNVGFMAEPYGWGYVVLNRGFVLESLEDWHFKLVGAECEGVDLYEFHTLCAVDNCRICTLSTV